MIIRWFVFLISLRSFAKIPAAIQLQTRIFVEYLFKHYFVHFIFPTVNLAVRTLTRVVGIIIDKWSVESLTFLRRRVDETDQTAGINYTAHTTTLVPRV